MKKNISTSHIFFPVLVESSWCCLRKMWNLAFYSVQRLRCLRWYALHSKARVWNFSVCSRWKYGCSIYIYTHITYIYTYICIQSYAHTQYHIIHIFLHVRNYFIGLRVLHLNGFDTVTWLKGACETMTTALKR